MTWMLYGATGYTGRLIARRAAARGERIVLAGRSIAKIAPLAAELGLEHRIFALDDPAAVRRGLEGVESVAHCAGPFSATALPMARACLDTGTHYLDITGEIDVFEQLHALDGQARAAKVVLLPGAGFDVVPTDCLAATVAAALPSATRLDLAFLPGRSASPGTARTAIESLPSGGKARIDGEIRTVPIGWRRTRAAFASGPRTVTAIPWGDVSTAYYSTGIPNITTYTSVPPGAAVFGRVMRLPAAQAVARAAIGALVRGPSAKALAGTHSEAWALASDEEGRSAQATLMMPNAYELTVESVLRIMPRLAGLPPGTQTPSKALGAGFITEFAGVTLTAPDAK
ncbi:saccharopine dehydrogenase NADP-binding domain-containing protein [Streptomyces sp. H10-C2]|uniref:saccharopine dehydrogenase family protein n=1 Tax=unclassified Streptomyces TaxID=2593676 RepID=UPI0024B9F5D1|nr:MULTISPECIES: saccharopine dehydrogenase NADP-binding domain-containing protein [unclassified Streptomyces]MDJ0346035.1 saccharopine dehydrogenase NADP-binding domain-containing protein [Streptomyces sp. PH10-H1]MDJ0372963.1 saccharopine dehydrogenase NADP-binding domain-containing protein [Streptomyces sp. H10-C2]